MTFHKDGFEVVALLSATEVQLIRYQLERQFNEILGLSEKTAAGDKPGSPLARRLEVIAKNDPSHAEALLSELSLKATHCPEIEKFSRSPRIRARAEKLCGVALGENFVGVRANVPAISMQHPGFHSDVVGEPPAEAGQIRITCWLPLMDAGHKNGGLEVVRGFRVKSFPHLCNRGYEISDSELATFEKTATFCPIGSAVFLDRFTPHRTCANTTNEARVAVVLWMRAA